MPLTAPPTAEGSRASAFPRCAGCSQGSRVTGEGNPLSTRSYICLNFVFKYLLIIPHPVASPPAPAEPLPSHPSSVTGQTSGKKEKKKKIRWKPRRVKAKEEEVGL